MIKATTAPGTRHAATPTNDTPMSKERLRNRWTEVIDVVLIDSLERKRPHICPSRSAELSGGLAGQSQTSASLQQLIVEIAPMYRNGLPLVARALTVRLVGRLVRGDGSGRRATVSSTATLHASWLSCRLL